MFSFNQSGKHLVLMALSITLKWSHLCLHPCAPLCLTLLLLLDVPSNHWASPFIGFEPGNAAYCLSDGTFQAWTASDTRPSSLLSAKPSKKSLTSAICWCTCKLLGLTARSNKHTIWVSSCILIQVICFEPTRISLRTGLSFSQRFDDSPPVNTSYRINTIKMC